MLESKRRAIIFITLSLLLAIAAGLLVLDTVKKLNSDLGGMTKIYVAASDIPSRTELNPKQLRTEEIPYRYVNDSHITDVKDLINKVLVVPITEGDIITKTMVKPVSIATNENNRLVMIPQSERVRFDHPEFEALDRVDIIVSHKFEGNPVTETFMKDVLVSSALLIDGKFSGIVVEVTAEDAPKIIHMQNYADSMRLLKANVGNKNRMVDNSAQTMKQEKKDAPKETEQPKPEEQQPVDEVKPKIEE